MRALVVVAPYKSLPAITGNNKTKLNRRVGCKSDLIFVLTSLGKIPISNETIVKRTETKASFSQ